MIEPKIIEIGTDIDKESQILKEISDRLQYRLKQTENKILRCPITGLYNYKFFRNYLSIEIKDIISENSEQNPGLIIVSLDNISKIIYSYGYIEVEEILKNTVCILESLIQNNEVLFEHPDEVLICYIPHTTKEKIINYAETIKNLIALSEKFIEKITTSIGVVCLDEIRAKNSYINEADELMYNVAIMRVKLAKDRGMNTVCSESQIEELKGEVGSILLVDTDVMNIDVMKTFLEKLRYKVVTASDGEEALSIADKMSLDLIVSEIMIPKIDGFLVREKLLSQLHTKNIQFIITSYLKDDDTVKRAATLGVEHYFKKPFMLSEFLGVVQNKIKRKVY